MGTNWHKSSYSGNANPNCVECRASDGQAEIRDSTRPESGHLTLPAAEWRAFLAAVMQGEL
jgi:hypothetical protein